MTTHQVQLKITAGPSREELFDALRLRHEGREVPFTLLGDELSGSERFRIKGEVNNYKVDSIEEEDGSGNCWNLTLSMGTGDDFKISPSRNSKILAFYSTKTREGFVRYETAR